MEIKQQVCSLPLAQRLKELGVGQESVFRWTFWASPNGAQLWDDQTIRLATEITVKEAFDIWDKGISAFTVAELGEMLPTYNFEYPYSFKMSSGTEWSACWVSAQTQRIIHQAVARTEADARARMLIYLLENNLISV